MNDLMKVQAQEIATIIEQKRKAADPFTTTGLISQATGKELADTFIDLTINESKFLSMIRTHRTNRPAGDITKLTVSGYVLRGATENSAATETRRPTTSAVSYSTKKLVGAIDLSGEVGEDNIEGEGGRNTIMNSMLAQIANNWEELAIEGDESVVGATDYAALVSANDGFNALASLANGSHILSAAGGKASYALLTKMLRQMPTKYRDKSRLRFFVSADSFQDLVDEQAARVTQDADAVRASGMLSTRVGVPIVEIPLWPQDLAITGTASLGTFILLCDPQNLINVIQRDIRIEWQRQSRKDIDEGTVFMRNDFVIENHDAVVKATNVSIDTAASYYS